MRCACVDVGTTTTRLLVAEADPASPAGLRVVASARSYTDVALGSLAGAVAEQLAAARAAGAEAVDVVGTAGLRAADPRLPGALAEAVGHEVRVLSGAEEAAHAFAGATLGLRTERPVAVVDLGGGSMELAAGVPGGTAPPRTCSIPVGARTLADRHLFGDPPTRAELDAVREAADAALAGVEVPPVGLALAVGGSAMALCVVLGGGRDRGGGVLTPALLDRALRALTADRQAALAARTGLDPRRVRLLPAGLLLLRATSVRLRRPLRVAGGGLREGLCAGRLGLLGG